MPLNFYKIIFFPKYILIFQGSFFSFVVLVAHYQAGYFSGKTGRKTNQSAGMIFMKFFINARLVIETFKKSFACNFNQIFISSNILGQKHQMIIAIINI